MRASGWIGVALVAALGGCDSLVGGECAEGLVPEGDRCIPRDDSGSLEGGGGSGGDALDLSGGAGGSTSSSGSGGTGTGPGCVAPEVSCGGLCVDLQEDISHCGACGQHCATELCVDGQCLGEPVGHTVVIGMSYTQSTASSRKILGNAVFRTLHQPLRLLFVRPNVAAANGPLVAVVEEQAAARGRTCLIAVAGPHELAQQLAASPYDVVLVEDLAGKNAGTLEELGLDHEPALSSFRAAGGTVVALATGQGCVYLDAAGLLPCEESTDVTGTTVQNAVATDTVGNGVVAPFLAKPRTSSFSTSLVPSAGVAWVFTDEGGEPVVIHRLAP